MNNNDKCVDTTAKSPSYTKRQWIILCAVCSTSFASGACASIYAPLFPAEAEKKNASATEYGLVVGMFGFVSWISSPLFGKYIDSIGAKIVFCGGIAVAAFGTILFGLLDLVHSHLWFIVLSFGMRVVSSLGIAATNTASLSTIIAAFPHSAGTNSALIDGLDGFGCFVGPIIGGYLFTVGGFITPFMVLGTLFLITGFIINISLPSSLINSEKTFGHTEKRANIFTILKIPSVFIFMYGVVSSSLTIGFNAAILEPHIRQFALSPTVTGLIVALSSASYPIASLLVGRLCDVGVNPSKIVIVCSALLILSYLLIGPMPFIPVPTTLWMVCIGLLLNGFAYGGMVIAAFIGSISATVGAGFSEDLTMYGILTGIWLAATSLGDFIGASCAGVLFDLVGFRQATLLIIVFNSLLLIAVAYQVYCPSHYGCLPVARCDQSPLLTNQVPSEYGSTDMHSLTCNMPLSRHQLSAPHSKLKTSVCGSR